MIQRIFLKVNSYFVPLGCHDTDSIRKSGICQIQFKKALKRAEKRKDIAEEAKKNSEFIKNRQRMQCEQQDLHIERRIFKLVKTEEEFINLNNIEELTETGERIRIAFKEKFWTAQSKEKSILRKSQYLLRHSKKFSEEFDCFNFEDDLKKTGIYYIYILEQ